MSSLNNKLKATLINADCLDALARIEDNSVHLVYLDPPWNLGSDFVHIEGKKSQRKEEYNELIFKVIQQSYRVLKPNGNLVVYSVPSLNLNFHDLIRPVFGEKNFRAEFIIPTPKGTFSSSSFRHSHETVICYSKSEDSQFFPFIEMTKDELDRLFPLKENGRRFRLESLIFQSDRPALSYSWKGFLPPKGKVWRYSKEKLEELEKEGNIFYEKDLAFPKLKIYSDEKSPNLVNMVSSVWNDIKPYAKSKLGHSHHQSKEIISRIVNITTQKGDTICDPFSGSGVTGIVSFKNNRNWIGIEIVPKIIETASLFFKDMGHAIVLDRDFIIKNKIVWDDYSPINQSLTEGVLLKISKGENERVEFKQSYNYDYHLNIPDNELPKKVISEIAAFINSAYGGTLFLGVKDDGTILGLQKNFEQIGKKKDRDAFELALTSKLRAAFGGLSVDLIEIFFHEIESKIICEIKIKPHKEPVFFNDDFYVRNGTQCNNLKSKEFYELMSRRKKI